MPSVICQAFDDSREIKCIHWDSHRFYNESDGYKIVIYREAGQGGYVPWAAIYAGYAGDKLIARADCAGATIYYE